MNSNLTSAGKSTLLSLLAGYLRCTTGGIIFSRETKIPLGIVPQKNVLIDELTCEQTVKLFYDLKSRRNYSRRERTVDVRQLLEDVGLWSRRTSQAGKLSGGMKRRLQLAIGIAGNSECKAFIVTRGCQLILKKSDLLVDEVRSTNFDILLSEYKLFSAHQASTH